VDVFTEAMIQVMLHEEERDPHNPLIQNLTEIRVAVWTPFITLEGVWFPPDGPDSANA
jgi:hypothetical protein